MSRRLLVEVWFDFICPWCLIGKRNLDAARALLRSSDPDVELDVRWQGLQLLPDAPAKGWPFMEFYLRRLGSEAAVRARQATVLAAARAAGADIDFHAIGVMPNTANAHRLYDAVCAKGTPAQAEALMERLFAAHFLQGADIGNRALLLAEAAAAGVVPEEYAHVLRSGADSYTAQGYNSPAGGVPCYVVDASLVVSGAQPPAMLHEVMRRALADTVA
jgi:predicted DsbA family dithiol-disulfide isomerase